jgi:hypothetical protein
MDDLLGDDEIEAMRREAMADLAATPGGTGGGRSQSRWFARCT